MGGKGFTPISRHKISLLGNRRDIDGYKVSISVEKTPNFLYNIINNNLSSGY